MITTNYTRMIIGIWGMGVVGRAAVRFFHARGARIITMDAQQPDEELRSFLAAYEARLFSQDCIQDFFALADSVLASPGINRALSGVPSDVQWLSELDLFAQEWHKPIIAITGSVGKTSVTTMLASCLRACGKRVALGGNIGVSVLDLLNEQHNADYAVIEVSSFQLEQCTQFAPDLALWTTFGSNHLDRHGTMQNYFDAKFQIMARQKSNQTAIVSPDITPYLTHVQYSGNLLWFALRRDLLPGAGYYVKHDAIVMYDQTSESIIYPCSQLPNSSFLNNWLLVIAALDQLNIQLPDLRSCAIELPAHRLEYVGSFGGASFYNDSKSTTISSTAAALERFAGSPIVLFIGGTSKGVDRRSAVAAFAQSCRLIYCFGAEAQQLAASVSGCLVFACATLEQAVDHYVNHQLSAGDCVLFSPSGASFDLYRNYQERGDHFKALVQGLIAQQAHLTIDV